VEGERHRTAVVPQPTLAELESPVDHVGRGTCLADELEKPSHVRDHDIGVVLRCLPETARDTFG
jgi:hypothetical protein